MQYWPIMISLITLALGVFVRALHSFYIHNTVNWDEAPQAFMALQIARGDLFPLVHFQLPYVGAVEQYPLALLLLLLGEGVSTLRLYYFLLSCTGLVAAFFLYRRLLPGRWADFALALFALFPPILLFMSLQSYSFAGLIVCETFALWGIFALRDGSFSPSKMLALGLLNGVALYNNVLFAAVLVFSLWAVYQATDRSGLRWFCAGVLVGYSPMLIFNIGNDFVSYQIMVAKFFGITQAMVDESGIVMALLRGTVLKAMGGRAAGSTLQALYEYPPFFLQQGYAIQWVAFALAAASCALGFVVLHPRFGRTAPVLINCPRSTRLAFYGLVALLLLTATGEMRYLTALVPILPICLCEGLFVGSKYLRWSGTAIATYLLLYLSIAHYEAYEAFSLRGQRWYYVAVEEMHTLLESKNLTHGYGSYPFQTSIAYLSEGEIKVSTQIGPIYMDKLPHFSQAVDRERDVFYIVPADSVYLSPLAAKNISYRLDASVASWWLLWNFSERVYPLDLIPQRDLERTDGYGRWSYRVNPKVLNIYRGGH